jgi:hypothetical protein
MPTLSRFEISNPITIIGTVGNADPVVDGEGVPEGVTDGVTDGVIEGVGVTDAVAVNVEMAELDGSELLVEELELVGSADLVAVKDEIAEIDA